VQVARESREQETLISSSNLADVFRQKVEDTSNSGIKIKYRIQLKIKG